jgi:glucokinase
MKVVTADVGGTHARFAVAELAPGQRPQLGKIHTYRTREHEGLAQAWQHFAEQYGEPLPKAASIAAAAAIGPDVLTFVNNDWQIDTRSLQQDLGVDRLTLLNDFGAMAHAVSVLEPSELEHVHGPKGRLPADGVTTVMGPGTGLGVAILLRRGGHCHVIETEGGHYAFAPLDSEEFAIAEQLRDRFGRVSLERYVSGPGLENIMQALAEIDGTPTPTGTAAELWQQALDGSDARAAHALERIILAFGSAAGDYALGHGSNAVVLTGSLVSRLLDRLRGPLFVERFCAKGRHQPRMLGITVRAANIGEAGLLGAAVAFQREHA